MFHAELKPTLLFPQSDENTCIPLIFNDRYIFFHENNQFIEFYIHSFSFGLIIFESVSHRMAASSFWRNSVSTLKPKYSLEMSVNTRESQMSLLSVCAGYVQAYI